MKEWEYVINTVEYYKMHIFTYLLITQKQFHDYKVELFFKEQLFNNVKVFFVDMRLNLYTLWFYIILFVFE